MPRSFIYSLTYTVDHVHPMVPKLPRGTIEMNGKFVCIPNLYCTAITSIQIYSVVQKKTFQHNFIEYEYEVHSIQGNDAPSIDLGSVGDLAIVNDTIWVRHPQEWRKCTEGTDNKGRPLQRHPTLPRRVLYETEWKGDKIQIKKGRSNTVLLYFKLIKSQRVLQLI
jgi:hypothetical protein